MVLVITPYADNTPLGLSNVVRSVSQVVLESTNLNPRSAEQAGVDMRRLEACAPQERLSCWVQVSQTGGLRGPVFIFSLRADEARVRISGMLIDGAEALRLVDGIDRSDADWKARLEDRIYEELTTQASSSAVSPESLQGTLRTTFQSHFRPALEKLGAWAPGGRFRLEGACAGCSLALDGRPVSGRYQSNTLLFGVPEGSHQLTFQRDEDLLLRCEATAQTGRTVAVPLVRCKNLRPPPSSARLAVQWGGVATSAAGVALSAVALAFALQAPRSVCLGQGTCDALGAPGFGFQPSNAPSGEREEINPGTVRIAALGAGVLVTGVSWALGGWLVENERWWLPLLIGLGAGGASFALGQVLGAP